MWRTSRHCSRPYFSNRLGQYCGRRRESWVMVGAMLGHGWCNVGSWLTQSWVMVGTMFVNSWCNVHLLLAYGWCNVGLWLVQCWLIVGATLANYSWRNVGL